MSESSDPEYLLTSQYRDAANLQARIRLHEMFSTNPYGWFPWVFDQFDLPLTSMILELGCGPGDLWLANKERLPEGWELTLSDFSPGMVSQARQNLQGLPHQFNFEIVDAQAIPHVDGKFNALISNHMLYHLPDLPQVLTEFRRVLKPGGYLYTTTVGEGHMRELTQLVFKFDPEMDIDLPGGVDKFTLENSWVQLQECFPNVSLRRYDDDLVVTQAAPLVDYILSSLGLGVTPDLQQELTGFIAAELERRNGSIQITKDSGMLVAF